MMADKKVARRLIAFTPTGTARLPCHSSLYIADNCITPTQIDFLHRDSKLNAQIIKYLLLTRISVRIGGRCCMAPIGRT